MSTFLEAINSRDIPAVIDIIQGLDTSAINSVYDWNSSKTKWTQQSNPNASIDESTLPVPNKAYKVLPLNLAVLTAGKELTSILLEAGADPNLEDEQGRNALVCGLYGIDTLKMEKATFPYLTKNRPSQLRIIQCILPKISEENLNKPLICLRGTTILCFACYLGKEDTVKLLLSDDRVNVDAFDCKGATALMYAVREGHHSIVKLLVQQGAKSDRTNLEGFSSLQYSRKSVLITMELECALIRHRAKNASDQYEYIDYAQQLNRAVEAKLAKVSQIDSEQSSQNQPKTLELIPGEDHLKLNQAIQDENLEDIKRSILSYYSKTEEMPQQVSLVNFHDKVTGLTPLHKVIKGNSDKSLDIMWILYYSGADVNGPTWSGRTPLHHVCLLAAQTIPSGPGSDDDTSQMITSKNSAEWVYSLAQAAETLIKMGARLDIPDKKGKTPLHYAVKGDSSFAPLVSVLMEHGANPHAQDKSQRTPQNMAKNPEIIQLLKVTPRQSLSSVASDLSSTGPDTPKQTSLSQFLESTSQVPKTTAIRKLSLKNASVQANDIHADIMSRFGNSIQPRPVSISSLNGRSDSMYGGTPDFSISIHSFLDSYRNFHSSVITHWIPISKILSSFIVPPSNLRSGKGSITLPTIQNSRFKSVVTKLSSQVEDLIKQLDQTVQTKDVLLTEIHTKFDKLVAGKQTLLTSYQQAYMRVPKLKEFILNINSQLTGLDSECQYLTRILTHQRSTFVTECHKQMGQQKEDVKSNTQMLAELLKEYSNGNFEDPDAEPISTSVLSRSNTRKKSSHSKHNRTTSHVSNADSIAESPEFSSDENENQLESLYNKFRETQKGMEMTKLQLRELLEHKKTVYVQLRGNSSSSSLFGKRDGFKTGMEWDIPTADLVQQAERLSEDHEQLLQTLQNLIQLNSDKLTQITDLTSKLKQSAITPSIEQLIANIETAIGNNSNILAGSAALVGGDIGSSALAQMRNGNTKRVVDLMLQVQRIDASLYSLQTWCAHKIQSLKNEFRSLDSIVETMITSSEEIKCTSAWVEQNTRHLEFLIQEREETILQNCQERRDWISRNSIALKEISVMILNATEGELKSFYPNSSQDFLALQGRNIERSSLELIAEIQSHEQQLEAGQKKLQSFGSSLNFHESYFMDKLERGNPDRLGILHQIKNLEKFLVSMREGGSTPNQSALNNLSHHKLQRSNSKMHRLHSPSIGSLRSTFGTGFAHSSKPSYSSAYLNKFASSDSGSDGEENNGSFPVFTQGSVTTDRSFSASSMVKSAPALTTAFSSMNLRGKYDPFGHGDIYGYNNHGPSGFDFTSDYQNMHPMQNGYSSSYQRKLSKSLSSAILNPNRENYSSLSKPRLPPIEIPSYNSTRSNYMFSQLPHTANPLPGMNSFNFRSNSNLEGGSMERFKLRKMRSEMHMNKPKGSAEILSNVSGTFGIKSGKTILSDIESTPTSPTSPSSTKEKLVQMLLDTRKEILILERSGQSANNSPNASSLSGGDKADERRQHVIMKKKAQCRQISFTLKKLAEKKSGDNSLTSPRQLHESPINSDVSPSESARQLPVV